MSHSPRFASALAGPLLLVALTATTAVPAQESSPRAASVSAVDLSQALAYTLTLDPAIRIAQANARSQYGVWVEAQGAFDSRLAFDFVHERSRGELLPSQVEAEEQRRDLFRTIIDEFTSIADGLEEDLEEGRRPVADCRSAFIVINGIDICVSDSERLANETFDEMVRRLIADADPETRSGIEALQQQQLDQIRQLTQNIILALRNQVTAAQRSLELLGVVPDVEEEFSIALDLRVQKLTRRGFAWSVGAAVDSLEDNYDGKSLNPALGGKGIPNTFRSFYGLALQVPLGEGRGIRSTTALERAARHSHLAARYQAVHRVDESLLRTLEAYFRTLAAQERVALLRDAVDLQGELSRNVAQLIEADELPRITQSRIDARVATLEQSLAAAEQAAVQNRIRLADALGLEIADLPDAPTASGSLPIPPTTEHGAAFDESELIARALEQRYDLRTAEEIADGSAILLEAARLDLKRPLDLTFALGYAGLHESFTDQYYDPGAFADALFGKQAGPSAFLGLKLSFPLRNRAARGREAQSRAVAAQSGVREAELRRAIAARVTELEATLAAAAVELERRQAAVDFREDELGFTMERFRYGEATLIDSIFTEENATFARLDLVDAKLEYALSFVRLRFAVGDLTVDSQEDGVLTVAARAPVNLFELPVPEDGP